MRVSRKNQYSGSGVWKVHVLLPEQQATGIQRVLRARGITCSELVRTAVADYLAKIGT